MTMRIYNHCFLNKIFILWILISCFKEKFLFIFFINLSSSFIFRESNIITIRDGVNLTASSNYSLNISNALKTNIDANNANIINNYLPLSGGTLSGNLSFGSRINDFLIDLYGGGYGFGINGSVLRYNTANNASHRFYTGTINTVTIDGSGNVGIGITNPFASLCIGTPLAISDGTLVLSRKTAVTGNRNFKFGYDTDFNFCMGDFGGDALTTSPWTSNQLTINWNNGNIGIGIIPQSQKLYVNGSTAINGAITATSFSGDGANITNVPYSTITGKPSTFPVDTTIYYNKTEVNTLITNTSNYTSNVSNILLTAISLGTSTNTSNYASNISNIIIANNSNFTLGTSNIITTNINTNYLKLAGGTMTGNLNIGSTIQSQARLILSGQEFYTPSFTSTDGIAFLVGVNRTNNKQLWIGDSANLTSNTTNCLFVIAANSGQSYLSSIATNGITQLPLNINASSLSIGTNTSMTGQLNISTSTFDNQITLTTTATNNFCSIRFKNNGNNYGYIGIAATANTGYYVNNLFLEATNAIVFNTGGQTSASANSPVMILNSSGNLGIGTTNPNYKLHLRGSNPTILRVETNTSDVNQVSGIEFGIPAFTSAGSAKITSTTSSGDVADLQFHTSATTNSSSAKMTIRGDGNVGIGNANPSQILQVGNAGRLRISNGTTDYSLLGTIDTDGALNTRIVISGNTRSAPYTGNIEYVATSSGSHIFYTTDTTQERMRINSTGIITTSSNIDCGGGIAITGANAFFTPGGIITGDNGVDSNNLTNTYINFKNAGATGDWCYIRQIGTSEAYKLALDFHDDNNDARFCIRNVQSSVAGGVDVVREVFTVDNGNVGIGTNNPQTELELYDTTNPKIYLNHNGTSRYFISGTSTSIDIGCDNGASKTIRFMPDNTERMIINSSGNVGIGTNNPNLNLQIGSTNANHNIGRAILTAGNIHDADKRDFLSIGRWDGASTADWQFTGLKYGVITGAASGEGADNHSCITFHTWGNSISNSREVMRINSRGVLSILNNLIYNYLFNNTGFNHATINSFDSITEFGYRFIQGTTGGPGTHGSVAQYYQWSIGLGIDFAYSNYVCQFALPRNIANPVLSVRFKENGTWGSWSGITAEALTSGNKSITGNLNVSGNVGIGTATSTTKLHIDHTSTTFNAANGGLYLINSNNVANNCSVIGASIGGSTASKAGLSLNVNGNYGWSMYINGSDTTNKTLRFNSSGDSSGSERLQIRGSDGYTIFTGNMQIASSTGSGSLIIGNSTSAVSLTLSDIATAVWKIETGNTNLTFSNDSPTGGTFISKMIITSGGNLLVRGDISAFANMSDRRLKHNINDLSINCIDLLNNIKPVEFIWNDMDEIINTKRNTHDHGFIAQDIELLLPNLVNQYDKYKSIKYEKLTPYLVKGSQELYKLIQDLQVDNIRQQQQIIDLQNQLNMIKSQLS